MLTGQRPHLQAAHAAEDLPDVVATHGQDHDARGSVGHAGEVHQGRKGARAVIREGVPCPCACRARDLRGGKGAGGQGAGATVTNPGFGVHALGGLGDDKGAGGGGGGGAHTGRPVPKGAPCTLGVSSTV